jgi:hypothetical protein
MNFQIGSKKNLLLNDLILLQLVDSYKIIIVKRLTARLVEDYSLDL